jgi:sigma-B regulation protein RsbU (phosphoserine phosphatase)
LLRRADGSVAEIDLPSGRLLGFDTVEQPFECRRVSIQPGETLCLYSDGVTEARGPADDAGLYGLERFIGTLSGLPMDGSLESWAAATRAAIASHTGTSELADDVTMLFFRRRMPVKSK